MKNSKSSLEHRDFVTKTIAKMREVGASSTLPPSVRPRLISPLGVVSKPHFDKLRLVVYMRYVNEHLFKRIFKFEGLPDIADMGENDDYSVSYDLASGYYHVSLHPDSRHFV